MKCELPTLPNMAATSHAAMPQLKMHTPWCADTLKGINIVEDYLGLQISKAEIQVIG